MKDKEAREAIKLTKERLDELEDRIHMPFLGEDGKASSYFHSMSVNDAIQHLINCLDITYSPDKFNH